MSDSNSSPLTDLPAVRLASGIEPSQKWTVNEEENVSKVNIWPKLIKISPTQGYEGTVMTVILEALPLHILAKLAFNSLMVDTKQMRGQQVTTLVAHVPPFQQTHSTTSFVVPISICFLDKDMVTETWQVAKFEYSQQPQVNNIQQEFHFKNDNDFLNSSDAAAGYSPFYSATTPSPFGFESQHLPSTYQAYYQQQQQPQDQRSNQSYNNNNNELGGGYYVDYNSNNISTNETNELMQVSQQTNNRIGLKSITHIPPTSVANYQPYPGLISRINLDLKDNLDRMTESWTKEEWKNNRRLVLFHPEQMNNTIQCHFQSILPPVQQHHQRIIVSCIYWKERQDFYITSVDCIYLLESLMNTKFNVEEKNRIRRNLEGFRPLTVSKCKGEGAEFFKLIMSFPNPKPRNIEKDIKVFPWKALPYALKKIITKYTATSFKRNDPFRELYHRQQKKYTKRDIKSA